MKRNLSFRSALLAIAVSTCAALCPAATVTTWQIEKAGVVGSNSVTITLQGAFCRMDLSRDLTCLLDGDAGYAYQLFHPGKQYKRQTLEEFSALSPCAGATNTPPASPTGRSNVIAGYKTFEYKVTTPCGIHSFWVAPDYPDWKKLRDLNLATETKLASHPGFNSFSRDCPGMVLRHETVTETPGPSNQTTTSTNISTLLSVKVVADDPLLIQVPSDYKEAQEFAVAPPTNQMRFKSSEDHQAFAARRSAPEEIRMPLAGQMESRPAFLRTPPASAQQPATLVPPGQPTATYLSVYSWGGQGPHEERIVINTAANASPLQNNSGGAGISDRSSLTNAAFGPLNPKLDNGTGRMNIPVDRSPKIKPNSEEPNSKGNKQLFDLLEKRKTGNETGSASTNSLPN